MAGASVLPPAEVLLSKRVQEMVLNGEQPPAPYVSRYDYDATEDDYSTVSAIPIIDLGILASSKASTEEYEGELMKLKSALQSWGCFQAIGHGISSSFLDKITQVAREFFEQPMEEKKKCSKTVVEFEGYGADPVPEEGQSLDWSDRLFLDVHPKDTQKLQLWPETPACFREESFAIMQRSLERIHREDEDVNRAHFQSNGKVTESGRKLFPELANDQSCKQGLTTTRNARDLISFWA